MLSVKRGSLLSANILNSYVRFSHGSNSEAKGSNVYVLTTRLLYGHTLFKTWIINGIIDFWSFRSVRFTEVIWQLC